MKYLLILTLLLVTNCDLISDDWGEESSLNGTWSGYMESADGVRATMIVTLKDGKVSNGKLLYKSLDVSNIVGKYYYDGDKFEMDFDNEASDFEGSGSSSQLSGKRVVSGNADSTFGLTKQ